MKKKLLSLALAAVMGLGTAFAFTGCDFGGSKDSDNGNQNEQGNQGGNSGNQGGNSGNQGGNSGNQGGNSGNQGGNADSLEAELFGNLLNTPIANVALEASLEDMTMGAPNTFGYVQGAWANVTGYMGLTQGLNADLFVDYGSTGGSHGYNLVFARGEYVYTDGDLWDSVEVTASDFDALLDAYRQDADLALYRSAVDLGGVYAAVPSASPADMIPMELVVKLVGNLASVIGGYQVEEVSGGYTITFDLVSALNTLALNLSMFANSINTDTTVGYLLKNDSSFLNKTLKGLLRGIKASEILSFVPEEALAVLPAAGDADAFDYILTLIQDQSLVETLSLSEILPGVTKLEDLTVAQIATLISAMSGSEPLPEATLSAYLLIGKTIAAALGQDPLSTVMNLIAGRMDAYLAAIDPSLAEDAPSLLKAKANKLAITLKFNANKAFTGLEGVVQGFSVKNADGTPSADDLVLPEASASLTVIDSHTFANLSGIHYVSGEPDRTKFISREEETHSDSFTIEGLEDKVDCSISLTVTETQITVKLSPSKSNDFAETIVTIDVSEFPADKKPTEFSDGSMWEAERSSKSATVTFTGGDATVEAYLVVYYTDEYSGVNLSACLNRTDDPDDYGYYLGDWGFVEFESVSGVIA